ncbi:hypothetical protein BOX15_Mlig002539g3 [Macrostomum lignano]|uniref:Uncharacterized protein n=1 Tax=Macrostomum lignano TaxID=282301 RepID=A0A267D9N7_9PLAT|nr:hypothetical protein BOX15_Mlig002539g3 [Macrostomum lignano]
MRGGHAVEICSRVEFPDKKTRDVSVTVEATHSNGCHRVIMLKGLIAKKRPDLGPKVKDCRLRMDQIVLTRPNTSIEDWQKSITMSYDSDFQVGMVKIRTGRFDEELYRSYTYMYEMPECPRVGEFQLASL